MGFNDLAFSLKMRDALKKISRDVVNKERPAYRYGKVTSIDRVAYKCGVTMAGDSAPVLVNMGTIQPRDIGQVVRVEGIGTDRFITDVIGGASSTPMSVLGEANLNDIVAPGTYQQTSNVNATTARNYPAGGLVAGRLEVDTYFSPAGNNMSYQQYHTYPTAGGNKIFHRSYHATLGWSAWEQNGKEQADYCIRIGTVNQTFSAGLGTYSGFGADDMVGGTGLVTYGNYGIRALVAGLYRISASVRWEPTSNSTQVRIRIGDNYFTSDDQTSGRIQQTSSTYPLAVNDIVRMDFYSGGTTTTSVWATEMDTSLSVIRVGGL